MRIKLIVLSIALAGFSMPVHSQAEFICPMLKEGLRLRHFCDIPQTTEVHFKESVLGSEETELLCDGDTVTIRMRNSYKAEKGKNIIFIHRQYRAEKGNVVSYFMTYCAGTRTEGHFEWDLETGSFSNWSATRITQ